METITTEDKCGLFLRYYKAGLQINVELSNLANITEVDLEEKLHNWALNLYTSINCIFQMYVIPLGATYYSF